MGDRMRSFRKGEQANEENVHRLKRRICYTSDVHGKGFKDIVRLRSNNNVELNMKIKIERTHIYNISLTFYMNQHISTLNSNKIL